MDNNMMHKLQKVDEQTEYNLNYQKNANEEQIRNYVTTRVPLKTQEEFGQGDAQQHAEFLQQEIMKTGVVVGEQNQMLYQYSQREFEEADETQTEKDRAFKNVLPSQRGYWKDRRAEKKQVNKLRRETNEKVDTNTIREKKDLDFYTKYRRGFLDRHKGYASKLYENAETKYGIPQATVKDGLLPFMHVYKRKWDTFRKKSMDGYSASPSANKTMFKNYFNKGGLLDSIKSFFYEIANGCNWILSKLHITQRKTRSLRIDTLNKCLGMVLENPITMDMLTDKYYAKHAVEFEARLARIKGFNILLNDNREEWFSKLPKSVQDVVEHLVIKMEKPLEDFMNRHKEIHCLKQGPDGEEVKGEVKKAYNNRHEIVGGEDYKYKPVEIEREENESDKHYEKRKKDAEAAHFAKIEADKNAMTEENIQTSWAAIREQQLRAQEVMTGLINEGTAKLLGSVENDAKKARNKRVSKAQKKNQALDETVFKYDVTGELGQKVASLQTLIASNESSFHMLGLEINTVFEKFYRLTTVMDELKAREVILGKEKSLLSKTDIESPIMKAMFQSQRIVELRRNKQKQSVIQERMNAYENALRFLASGGEGELTANAKALLKAEGFPYVEHFPQWKKNYAVLYKDGLGKDPAALNDAEMADHFWEMRKVTRTQANLKAQLEAEKANEQQPLNALEIDYKEFSKFNITSISKLMNAEGLKTYRKVKCLTDFAKRFDEMTEEQKMAEFDTEEKRIDAEVRADAFRKYGAKWITFFERALEPKYYMPVTTLSQLNGEALENAENKLTEKYPQKEGELTKDEQQIQELIQEVKNQRAVYSADNAFEYFSEGVYENRRRHFQDQIKWKFIRYNNNAFADKTIVDIQSSIRKFQSDQVRPEAERVDAKLAAGKAKDGKDPEAREKAQQFVNQRISAFLNIKLDPAALEMAHFHTNIRDYLNIVQSYREMKSLMKNPDLKEYFDTYADVKDMLESRLNNGAMEAVDQAVSKYLKSFGFKDNLSGDFEEKLGEKDLGLVGMTEEKRKEEWEKRFGAIYKESEEALKKAKQKSAELKAAEQSMASNELFNLLYEKSKNIQGFDQSEWQQALRDIVEQKKWKGKLEKSEGLRALVIAEAERRLKAGPNAMNDYFEFQLRKNISMDFAKRLGELNYKIDEDAAAQIFETSQGVMDATAMQYRVLDIDTDSRLQEEINKRNEENKEKDKEAEKIDIKSFRLLLRDVYRQQNGLAINQQSEEDFKKNNADIMDYLKGNKYNFLKQATDQILSFTLTEDMFKYENIRANFKDLYKNALRIEAFAQIYNSEKAFFASDALPKEVRDELKWRYSKLAGGAYLSFVDMIKAYVSSQGVDEYGQPGMGIDFAQAEKDKERRDKTIKWYNVYEKLVKFSTGSYRHNKSVGLKIEAKKNEALGEFEKAYEEAKMPFMEMEAANALREVNKQYSRCVTDSTVQGLAEFIGVNDKVQKVQFADVKYLFTPYPINDKAGEVEAMEKNAKMIDMIKDANEKSIVRSEKNFSRRQFAKDMQFFAPMAGQMNAIMRKLKDIKLTSEDDVRKMITPELYIEFKKLNAYLMLAEGHRGEWQNGKLLRSYQAFNEKNSHFKGDKKINLGVSQDDMAEMSDFAGALMDGQFIARMRSFTKIMDIYADYVGVASDGTLFRDDVDAKVGNDQTDNYKVEIIEESRRKRKEYFNAVLNVMNTEKVPDLVLEYGSEGEKAAYMKNKDKEDKEKKKEDDKRKKEEEKQKAAQKKAEEKAAKERLDNEKAQAKRNKKADKQEAEEKAEKEKKKKKAEAKQRKTVEQKPEGEKKSSWFSWGKK